MLSKCDKNFNDAIDVNEIDCIFKEAEADGYHFSEDEKNGLVCAIGYRKTKSELKAMFGS